VTKGQRKIIRKIEKLEDMLLEGNLNIEEKINTAHSLTINLNSFSDEYDGNTAIHFQFKTEQELNSLIIAINEAFEKEVRK